MIILYALLVIIVTMLVTKITTLHYRQLLYSYSFKVYTGPTHKTFKLFGYNEASLSLEWESK